MRPHAALGAATAAAAIVGAISVWRFGPDFRDLLLGGSRLLAGTPLYQGSGPAYGMIGPPFQAVLLAPFAAIGTLSYGAALACWFTLNFAGLVCGARAWSAALRLDQPEAAWLILAAAAAVAFPIYREFQSGNLTLTLLWLMGLGAAALSRGHDVAGGAAIGAATAVKLFPGLAIAYLLARGRGRAAAAATLTAAALSLIPLVRYGPAGYLDLWRDWLRSRREGDWPVWDQNQSLPSTLAAAVPGEAGAWLGLLLLAALSLVALWIGWRRRASTQGLAQELAIVIGIAVLASPIAWVSYWLLFLPLFMITAQDAHTSQPGARVVFIIGALLVTVVAAWQRAAPGPELPAAAILLLTAAVIRLQSGSRHAAA